MASRHALAHASDQTLHWSLITCSRSNTFCQPIILVSKVFFSTFRLCRNFPRSSMRFLKEHTNTYTHKHDLILLLRATSLSTKMALQKETSLVSQNRMSPLPKR